MFFAYSAVMLRQRLTKKKVSKPKSFSLAMCVIDDQQQRVLGGFNERININILKYCKE